MLTLSVMLMSGSCSHLELGSLGEGWGIPQGCPLNMVSIVALCIRRCTCLESVGGIKPSLSAEKFKCVSSHLDALLAAARLSNEYIAAGGQPVAPSK